MDKFKTGIKGLSVERADIEEIGFNSETLLDNDMKELAKLLGKGIIARKPDFDTKKDSEIFWDELDSICAERYHLQPY